MINKLVKKCSTLINAFSFITLIIVTTILTTLLLPSTAFAKKIVLDCQYEHYDGELISEDDKKFWTQILRIDTTKMTINGGGSYDLTIHADEYYGEDNYFHDGKWKYKLLWLSREDLSFTTVNHPSSEWGGGQCKLKKIKTLI